MSTLNFANQVTQLYAFTLHCSTFAFDNERILGAIKTNLRVERLGFWRRQEDERDLIAYGRLSLSN